MERDGTMYPSTTRRMAWRGMGSARLFLLKTPHMRSKSLVTMPAGSSRQTRAMSTVSHWGGSNKYDTVDISTRKVHGRDNVRNVTWKVRTLAQPGKEQKRLYELNQYT
ncbi:hypothetical protein ACOMHN_042121 [Nucella lapillus]